MGIIIQEKIGGKKYIVRIRPTAHPWLFDRLSCIVEIRSKDGRIIEVWHLHIMASAYKS